MSLTQFIKENKEEIDQVIKSSGGTYFNYEERRQWILNDEGLYNWARSQGVRI